MKYISFIVILFSNLLLSQYKSYQLTYKITFVKDSTEQNYKYDEFAFLFINKEKSFFMSVNKYKSDSTLSVIKSDHSNLLSALSRPRFSSNFNFSIQKLKDSLIYKERIAGIGNFLYHEKNIFKNQWYLQNDSIKILNYTCKKATINYGGRIWYAWYTDDIPISDGPYKFNGLPGLILAVEDSKNQYRFEAMAIIKKDLPVNIEYNFSGQNILTTRDAFIKTKQNYFNNPIQVSNGRMNYKDKEQEKAFIERMKRNNNFIELK